MCKPVRRPLFMMNTETAEGTSTAPHVVMLVANDVSVDTRVRKMAHDLGEAGPRVTVLGISATGHRQVSKLGRATLVRVPVSSTIRTIEGSKLFPGRSSRYELISRIRNEQMRFQIHQREVGAKIGWIRTDHSTARARMASELNGQEAKRLERLGERQSRRDQRRARLGASGSLMARQLARLISFTGKLDRKAGQLLKQSRVYRFEKRLKRAEFRAHRAEDKERARLDRELQASESRVEAMRSQLTERDDQSAPGVLSRVDWRNELLDLHDYDAAFSPELDALDADVIHAHDVHLLGVAARATARAVIRGRKPYLVYDAHEYVQGLSRYSPRVLAGWSSLEREYIGRADKIITVSEPLADLLVGDYGLEERPVVVLNIPAESPRSQVSVRAAAGVEDDVPLLVYSGGMDPTRGVHTLVRAVGLLPGVHLALVAKAESNYVRTLVEEAESGGYGSRLHLVPFVEPQQVVSYLSTATAAVHPMVSGPMNHEIALPNKVFEYMHAELPMVVSSCRAMSQMVTELGVGEVFESEDVDSLRDSLTSLLGNIDSYRKTYAEGPELKEMFSWAGQRRKMLDIYSDILGPEAVDTEARVSGLPADAPVASQVTRLGIGPMNMAGQAWEWAKAVERSGDHIETEVFEIHRPKRLRFPADVRIEGSAWRSLEWQLDWAKHVASSFSHLLLESGLGALGRLNGGRLTDDVPFLIERGIRVGAVFHGSDIREPLLHRSLVEASPFVEGEDLTTRLSESAQTNLAMMQDFPGPTFVSTLDLRDYLPHASWLPQVIDLDRWKASPMPDADKLRVLFVPTNPTLKGLRFVERLSQLDDEGLIELKVANNVPVEEMPGLIAGCHVLIDGLVLGLYGTTSVEGMASGRIVLANLARVVDRQPTPAPIVNTNPKTLLDTVREIASDRKRFSDLANEGPDYVKQYHDGRFAAAQLESFLSE